MSDLVNPTEYGLLTTGFTRMRLPEIQQMIVTQLQTSTGLTFETRPDSISGQFINTFAEREAALWELAEAVYHAMYPISAFGVNLDHSVSFSGVKRLFAANTSAWCVMYGDLNTVIPAGSIVRNSYNQELFELQNDVTIEQSHTIDFTISVDTAITDYNYWVQINGVTYSYIALPSDDIVSIASSLYIQLEQSPLTLELDANLIRGYNINQATFTLMFGSNISLVTIGSMGDFTAQNTGEIEVAVGTLNQIVTTMTGWYSVNNLVVGRSGRNLETDDELRGRYNAGVFRLGGGTVAAIKANILQNVVGIQACEVFENDQDVMDVDGRPPHSIEVVVNGGDPQDIAQQIYNIKSSGISSFGNVTVNIVDSSGWNHPINFNRPVPIYIWIRAQITLYNEETFPDSGAEQIQQIIVDTGNLFGIGKDIIIQRFYGPIYRQISGIANINISVAKSLDPTADISPGDFVNTNVSIAAREQSNFDLLRTTVVITTS